MPRRNSSKRGKAKTILRLPDLEQSKNAVLNSLAAASSQESYGHANVRLAAVRRFAHEAADTGLLSPELAAGIGRVKGAKRLGIRIGNWLTVEQSRTLLAEPRGDSLRGRRDRAILALLIGCGLTRRTGWTRTR